MVFTTYLETGDIDSSQKDELLGNMAKYQEEYIEFKQMADSAKP